MTRDEAVDVIANALTMAFWGAVETHPQGADYEQTIRAEMYQLEGIDAVGQKDPILIGLHASAEVAADALVAEGVLTE